MKKNIKLILCCLGLVTLILIIYWPLTKTFYQQDEWMGYTFYLSEGFRSLFANTHGLIGLILGEGRVLTNLLHFLSYKFFPLNIFPIAIFAISFHIINTLIIFYLAKMLFKSNLSAFLGSLFFAVSSISQSAITWPAASINTLPSTMLILIALVFYFKYLENWETKYIFLSFILVYLSLFFKETGIFLFLLLPLFSLFYKKYSITGFIKKYWYFFVVVFLIVIYRLWGFKSETGEVALFLTGSSKYFLDAIMVRSILYPITSFSLSIVPPDIFLNFARYITNVYYPFVPEAQFILIAQTIVLDFLALFLTGIILFIFLLMFKKSDKNIQKQIVFWFIFLLASFLPYVIISKSYSYLESRYYYVGSISWSIVFAWFIYILQKKIKIKFVSYLLLVVYLVFIFSHVKTVTNDLDKLVEESQIRISIISQLKTIKPALDKNKNIFYITGDSDYYLVGNKIPFQNGMGYNLMSLYFDSGKIPKELINESFLFEIGSQGYKEMGDYGFGYFSDKRTLEIDMKRYIIPNESVHSFYYDSTSEKVTQLNDKTN